MLSAGPAERAIRASSIKQTRDAIAGAIAQYRTAAGHTFEQYVSLPDRACLRFRAGCGQPTVHVLLLVPGGGSLIAAVSQHFQTKPKRLTRVRMDAIDPKRSARRRSRP